MSACPSIAWTDRRSAPPSSRWLAKEWRSVCGEMWPRRPAPPARLLPRQRPRQPARRPRRLQVLRGIRPAPALAKEKAIESPDGRQVPGHTRGSEPGAPEKSHVRDDVGRLGLHEAPAARPQESAEAREIAPIGRQRVLGGTLFGLESPEELRGGVHHAWPRGEAVPRNRQGGDGWSSG